MTMAPDPRHWPPLIVAADVPRWIRWRDGLLTLLMWALFAFMLEVEFEILLGAHLERLGLGSFVNPADLSGFLERLIPYYDTALVLVALLFVAGLFTARRRRRGRSLPAPLALATADQARRAGLDEAALAAARAIQIVVVHVEADGRLRIEPRTAAITGVRPTLVSG